MDFVVTNSWTIGALIAFAAALTQTLTGFGFGLVSVPLLLFILPSQQAITLSMMLSLSSAIISGIKGHKQAKWYLIWKATIIGFPALITGTILSSRLDAVYLKALIGFALIIYISLQWAQSEKKRRLLETSSKEATSATVLIPQTTLNSYPRGFNLASLAAGLLTGVAGIPGPPIVSVLVNFLNKDIFHATVVNYFVIQYLIAVSSRAIMKPEIFNSDFIIYALTLIIPILLGNIVGTPIRNKIDETNFKRLVYFLLLIIGFTSVWEPIQNFIFSDVFSK